MASWTSEVQPFGANHAPLLAGVSSVDGHTPVPVAVDPTTGGLVTSSSTSKSSIVGIDPIGQYGVSYDTITYTATSGTVDTYIYKAGGIAGTTTATVTVTFTDSTHATLVSVVRT
jgi:hypothetical protein